MPSSPIPTMDSQRRNAALFSGLVSTRGSLATGMSRILILGGTTEAGELAECLAKHGELEVVVSLAGRTKFPAPQPARLRSGGFGGVSGLSEYLVTEKVDALIDATHPYADVISANGGAPARPAAGPFVALLPPPWHAGAGDRWQEVADIGSAVRPPPDPPAP